ncbi:hypothetical protein K1X45_02550 [Pseudochrobactrum sp. Wa41.01b-1]|uniref:hypothetical protein n=1 Tax=Pseudochrobactrum sp. Wa41.01b-1 TaxID=2864102 RepID=UPI001C68BE0F|nr:hypothetical protein [Pseudochrobactrum sp. Wa41.01b-1]QYM73341.1 hypothetical protein K1X45_02550 [Pseudochrobactrum sp. Wa41.01b-1]
MATATQDTRDRVIRMEGKVEELERKIDRLDTKVSEMQHLLTQAKGARWMLIFWVGFGGFMRQI